MISQLLSRLPPSIESKVRYFILKRFQIPLIGYFKPYDVQITKQEFSLVIPLKRKTKNHLGGLYFGVTCTGADAILAAFVSQYVLGKYPVVIIIKDFQINFTRQIREDALFVCHEGEKILKLATHASNSNERFTEKITILVYEKSKPQELTTEATVSLSMRKCREKNV